MRADFAICCACVLFGLATPGRRAAAQSTSDQQARVAALDDSLRTLGSPERPGRAPVERATDSTKVGALIVRSEPELTPFVRRPQSAPGKYSKIPMAPPRWR